MEYRVEQKYLVNESHMTILEQRLKNVLIPDPNMKEGSYLIRSIYFDDMYDSCLNENEAGVDNREKFRIRTYNNDLTCIKLELKSKKNGFTSKKSSILNPEEMRKLLNRCELYGTTDFLKTKISAEMQYRRLQPICIVEYERSAYIDSIGNVRITFDRNISCSYDLDSYSDNNIAVVPVLEKGIHILEIKYDELLPDYVKTIIEMDSLRKTSFSKYYYSRQTGGR